MLHFVVNFQIVINIENSHDFFFSNNLKLCILTMKFGSWNFVNQKKVSPSLSGGIKKKLIKKKLYDVFSTGEKDF